MDTLPDETAILYLWQNRHTIVVGRNQNPWNECKVEEFLESGGQIARRLSGGGAVYHDLGNLNFTFILPATEFDVPRQLTVIQRAVGSFGVPAQISGRNDVLAAGRKFSGNAFYRSGRAAYHHGTLMIQADTDMMTKYLTVDKSKLQQRGVASVSARVVNLSELCADVTVSSLQSALFYAFAEVYGSQPAMLDDRLFDQPTLTHLRELFADPEWIYPKALPYSFTVTERFPWGGATVKLHYEDGVIKHAKIFTDAMDVGIFERIEQALTGAPFLISAISTRFEQKIFPETDAGGRQMAADLCALICGKIRATDRGLSASEGENHGV